MKKRWLHAGLMLLVLLIILIIPVSAETSEGELLLNAGARANDTFNLSIYGTQDYDEINAVFEKVNEYRAEAGAAPLKLEPLMVEYAMQRAAELSVYYSHTRPDNTRCFTILDGGPFEWGSCGENIAMGYANAAAVSDGWYNSSGHYANMVNPNYKSIGIGCFYQDNGTRCWVQLFSSNVTESTANYSGTVDVPQIPITMSGQNAMLYLSPSDDCGNVHLFERQTQKLQLLLGNAGFGTYRKIKPTDCYSFTSADPAVVTCSGTVLTGAGTGETTVRLNLDTLWADIPVTVHKRPVLSYHVDEGVPTVIWEDPTGTAQLFCKEKKDELWTRPYHETESFVHRWALDGETYTYVLRILSGDDYVDISDPLTVTIGQPEPPKITAANVSSTGKIKLTWDAVDGAKEYYIYRSTSKYGTYKKIFTTTGTSFTNSSVTPGTKYYYKVRAVSPGGARSVYSNRVARTCDLARPKVTASNLSVSGKVKLSWSPVEGAVKYEIYRAVSQDGTYSRIFTTQNTTFKNTSVEAGKTYYYKVRAVCGNSAATSAYSLVDSITVDLARPDVTISIKNGKPQLTWDPVEGATGYEVYRATSANGSYTKCGTYTKTSFRNTSAKSGVTYYYRVRAVCSVSAASSSYCKVSIKTP